MKRYLAAAAAVAVLFTGTQWTAASAKTAVEAPMCELGKVTITRVGTNAPGADTNANRNKEFIRLSSSSVDACSLTGFKLHDSYQAGNGTWGNEYVIPTFELPAKGLVYVYTGSGVNDHDSLYRNFKHYLNNAGDTVWFTNATGTVFDKLTYSAYEVWAPLP